MSIIRCRCCHSSSTTSGGMSCERRAHSRMCTSTYGRVCSKCQTHDDQSTCVWSSAASCWTCWNEVASKSPSRFVRSLSSDRAYWRASKRHATCSYGRNVRTPLVHFRRCAKGGPTHLMVVSFDGVCSQLDHQPTGHARPRTQRGRPWGSLW